MSSTQKKNPDLSKKSNHYSNFFKAFLDQKGLRQTKQRELILNAVMESPRHLDAKQLADTVKNLDDSIGIATVYRTLKMMTEAGILVERNFNSDRAQFEFADEQDDHHDHLICTTCGTIIEFFDEEQENHQLKIAKNLGFKLSNHKLELFGDCLKGKNCKNKK